MRLQELLHGILPLWDTPACSWKRRKKEDRHEGGKWLKEIITLNPSHQHKQLVTQRAELPLIATQFCFFFKATHNFKQITDNIQLISLCFDVLRFAFTQIWRVGRYLLTHMQMDSQVKQRCSILLDNWCRWGNVIKNKKVKKKKKKNMKWLQLVRRNPSHLKLPQSKNWFEKTPFTPSTRSQAGTSTLDRVLLAKQLQGRFGL